MLTFALAPLPFPSIFTEVEASEESLTTVIRSSVTAVMEAAFLMPLQYHNLLRNTNRAVKKISLKIDLFAEVWHNSISHMVRILLVSLAFATVYNLLFFPVVFGIAFPIFILALHLYLYFVRDRDSKNTIFALILSFASVLLAFFCAIKSTESILGFNLLSILFLTFAAAYYYKQKKFFSGDTIQFLFSPVKTFFEGITACFTVFSNKSLTGITKKHSRVYGPLFQGFLLAIPIVIILFLLLMGGDPIFRTLVGKLSFSVSERVVASIIVFLAAFFWGLAQVSEDQNPIARKWSDEQGEKFALSSLVVSGSIALLFAVFLAIQLKYLFLAVPETELKHLGINIQTYSEYVRQGFFYLIFASVIATSVVLFILRNLHLIETVQKKYLQIIISLLSLETLLLMLSAGKRLLLYTEAHGLSHIRIFGAFFLVWLAAILVIMIFATFKKVKARYEFAAVFLVALATLTALNLIPIDKIIAVDYPPTVNHEVDTIYVARLSSDAYEAWLPLIAQMSEKQEKLLKIVKPTDEDWRVSHNTNGTIYELSMNVYYLDQKYSSGNFIAISDRLVPYNFKINKSWKAFNLGEYQAFQHIRVNRNEFEKLKTIYDSIDNLQNQWNAITPTPTPVVQPGN